MARGGFPSMTALLGLLAVAGYQNRDKISEMMRQHSGGGMGAGTGRQMNQNMGGGLGGQMGGGQMGGLPGGLGGLLGGLMGGGAASGGGLGGLLGGGLGELNQQMRQNGRGDVMDSWIGTGQNRQVEPHDLEAALGPDVLDDLTEHTGLSRQEILRRLYIYINHAVDQ